MYQSDSISVNTVAGEGQQVAKRHYEPTPAQIISWLPKNATPAQQDSAIQSRIKPKEIRWSQRPDTLHLPGHTIGKSIFDTSIPQYYKDNFFAAKEYYHPEIMGGRKGVAGDPVPYTIAGDNFMTSLLLICFMVTTVIVSSSRSFFGKHLKMFFYGTRGMNSSLTETSGEVRLQILLMMETCLLFAILYFFYLKSYVTETFTIEQYQIIGLLSGLFAIYFIVKNILYAIVNWVFFNKENIQHWRRSNLFLTACEGLLVFPIVFVQSYFDLSIDTSIVYVVLVVILFKLLSFYKQRQIFFRQKGQIVDIFLYFCALEIIPLVLLWKILAIVSLYLKVNF